jgi:hypothetical protein
VRVNNGPEYGAYYHKFFLRDHPHLAAQMFCKNARTMFAMASDVTEKKTDAVALQTKRAESTLTKESVDQMCSSLHQNGRISYGSGTPKIGDSAPSGRNMSCPYAMPLQSEKEILNNMVVNRLLQMRQQLCAPPMQKHISPDRQLQTTRLVELSMQQHLSEPYNELHYPVLPQRQHGDGQVQNINRASAA